MREAVTRTVKDNDHVEIFGDGAKGLDRAASLLRGYAQVGNGGGGAGAEAPWAPASSAEAVAGPPSPSGATRLARAAPQCAGSFAKLCYLAVPFFFGWVMACTGWQHRVNECPRNLDGILLWFGILVLMLNALMYFPEPGSPTNVMLERGRLAIIVMLAALNLVGFLWTMHPHVQSNKTLCGHSLVYWSMFVWVLIPVVALAYACFYIGMQLKRLYQKDQQLQHEIVL